MTGTEEKALEVINAKHYYTTYQSEDWMIVKFINLDDGSRFTAKGNALPTATDTQCKLYGIWENDKKYGLQFNVKFYEEILPTSEKGVISYLCSLKIGFGKRRAEKVWEAFGENVWDILDTDPDQIGNVRGVPARLVTALKNKIQQTRRIRSILALFRGYGDVTPARAKMIMEHFGDESEEVITNDPYRLCEVQGLGFGTVDKMALARGGGYDDPKRVCAAVTYVLDEAALRGHVCLPQEELIQNMIEKLSDSQHPISDKLCKAAVNAVYREKQIRVADGHVYTKVRFEQESSIAQIITEMCHQNTKIEQVDALIEKYQEDMGFKLADAQADAIRCVFTNTFTVLTGGPGTGKTTTTKAILYVHKLVFENKSNPVLLAPTGKASRRMAEATEYPANTIHSAIGYHEENNVAVAQENTLEGNLFIIDEASMMDQQITAMLLGKIPMGAKVVLCGDPDQLPSVGAGNVLKDLIDSRCVPVTKLNVVYRQGKDSPIISNAYAINSGDPNNLILNGQFKFKTYNTQEEIFEQSIRFYKSCVRAYGVDEVVLLCPYRAKGDISVNNLNKRIQAEINPVKDGDMVIKCHGMEFRSGDKVMMTKNTDLAKNGDVGYIRNITKEPDPEDPTEYALFAQIEWNDEGETHPYHQRMMNCIDLAYALTIHKSQGSEYQNVIMTISNAHRALLKRNLIYTGVTRAKKHCCIIGEYDAFKLGVVTNDSDVRYTLLVRRLQTLDVNWDKDHTANAS